MLLLAKLARDKLIGGGLCLTGDIKIENNNTGG